MPEQRTIRVLRLLEYIGPEEWVRHTLAHSTVQGTKYIPTKHGQPACITAMIISEHVHGEMPANPEKGFRNIDGDDQAPLESVGNDEDFPAYGIGVPDREGNYGMTHGLFKDLNTALLISPDLPNSVLICFKSRVDRFITHLWCNDHWAEYINGTSVQGDKNGNPAV